jgi:hypothetical protein
MVSLSSPIFGDLRIFCSAIGLSQDKDFSMAIINLFDIDMKIISGHIQPDTFFFLFFSLVFKNYSKLLLTALSLSLVIKS